MYRWAVITILFLNALNATAQDAQFSQFYSNSLYLAPSFAGSSGGSRITANYRNQWVGMPAQFITYSFSYDHYFPDFRSGIGLIGYKDASGTGELGTLGMGAMYSYNFNIKQDLVLRPGLQFSYLEHGLAWDKLSFIDEVMHTAVGDIQPEPLPKTRDVDMSLSLLAYNEKMWAGATFDHILKPNISLYAYESLIPYKIMVYGGYELIRRGRLLSPEDEKMTFAFLFKKQAQFTQLDLGVYWQKNPFVAGIWYRGIPPFNSQRGDALIVLAGYKTKYFNIGYSYDVTISNLISNALGSHELSLSLKFALPKRQKKGEVPCPEF